MAPTTATIAYPKEATFNMDYYMSTHMALVAKSWTQYDLQSWKVVKVDDPNSPYSVIGFLEFDSFENFGKATQSPETPAIMGDVANFSDKSPVLIPGTLVGSS